MRIYKTNEINLLVKLLTTKIIPLENHINRKLSELGEINLKIIQWERISNMGDNSDQIWTKSNVK